MKKFEIPEIEVIAFGIEDVITTSNGETVIPGGENELQPW